MEINSFEIGNRVAEDEIKVGHRVEVVELEDIDYEQTNLSIGDKGTVTEIGSGWYALVKFDESIVNYSESNNKYIDNYHKEDDTYVMRLYQLKLVN